MNISKLLSIFGVGKIVVLHHKLFWSLEKQARKSGVSIEDDNFINIRFCGAEPYLIKIVSLCALTRETIIFTHGGSHVVQKKHPDFDFFAR